MTTPDATSSRARSAVRTVLAVTLGCVVLLVGLEIALRAVYFQQRSSHRFALMGAAQSVAVKLHTRAASAEDEQLQGAWQALFSDAGQELRAELMARYRAEFATLAGCVRDSRARLVMLYLPMSPPASPMAVSAAFCRPFFQDTAAAWEVAFLDLSDAFGSRDWADLSLSPHDGHLARFGNRVVAREVAAFLEQYRGYRSGVAPRTQASRCGDLEPSASRLWEIDERMPYRVITNAQGFRNLEELDAIKQRQRILCLGDSFTFGPYLPNHDTYPAQLESLGPGLEVVNGGVGGYTITSESSLYCDSAHRIAPDVVILQVLDNDLYELLSSRASRFDRLGRSFDPSPAEREFLNRLRAE